MGTNRLADSMKFERKNRIMVDIRSDTFWGL